MLVVWLGRILVLTSSCGMWQSLLRQRVPWTLTAPRLFTAASLLLQACGQLLQQAGRQVLGLQHPSLQIPGNGQQVDGGGGWQLFLGALGTQVFGTEHARRQVFGGVEEQAAAGLEVLGAEDAGGQVLGRVEKHLTAHHAGPGLQQQILK